MKSTNIKIASVLAAAVALMWSCKKETDWKAERVFTEPFSYVRVVNAAPNFRNIFSARDSINLSFSGAKLNGGYITYNSIFPSANYSAVPAGEQIIRFNYGVRNPDSITIFSINKQLEANKYYSLIITDSIKSNRESAQMWIRDDFSKPDTGMYSIRFIHTVMDDTAGKAVDLYSVNQKKNLFTNVQKGSATQFANQQYVNASDTLIVRRSGTVQELARVNGITQGNQRVYTTIYKGSTLVTGTASRARSLLTYLNL